MSIRRRLVLMMAALFVTGVGYLIYDLLTYQAELRAQKQSHLTDLVSAQATQLSAMISANMNDANTNNDEILASVGAARYAGSEYFFIIDRDLNMVMHPFKTALNGTSVANSNDPDGVYLFREMKKAVQGGSVGFVEYKWPRPGSSKPIPKLSAVVSVSGTNWILGSGVYIDDISSLLFARALKIMSYAFVWLLIMGGCTVYFTRAINTPIRRVEHCMERLSEGDLSGECASSGTLEFDNLSLSINSMRKRIGAMISYIHADSEGLLMQSNKLDDATREVRNGSKRQHEELDQLSVAMTEMVQTIHVMANIARDASQNMGEVTDAAKDGERSMDLVQERIYQVLEQLESAAASILQMNTSAEQISNVAEVIASISEQTNLLALNAAIEAARAGESGRGFAVVADEVRTLAQRTGVATNEIKEVIDAITSVAGSSVAAMKLSADQTRECAAQVDSTRVQLHEISAKMNDVQGLNIQVATSVTQQEQVATEMDKNLTAVARAADAHSGIAQQLELASNQVGKLSNDVSRQLSVFRTA